MSAVDDLPTTNAFAVYPDSVSFGLSYTNDLVAIFKHREQAMHFGTIMWGAYFIVKPITSEHFK